MDASLLTGATMSVAVGYLIRSSLGETKPECPPCNCVCHWKTGSAPEPSSSGFSFWIVGALALVVVVILISNFALVCKITLRDGGAGADREIQINVKGKSGKGVYSGRGLAITG